MSAIDAKKAEIIKMLEKFWGVVPDSLKAAGVSRPTFYKWCREDEAFMEKVDEIVETKGKLIVDKLKRIIETDESEGAGAPRDGKGESHDGE